MFCFIDRLGRRVTCYLRERSFFSLLLVAGALRLGFDFGDLRFNVGDFFGFGLGVGFGKGTDDEQAVAAAAASTGKLCCASSSRLCNTTASLA